MLSSASNDPNMFGTTCMYKPTTCWAYVIVFSDRRALRKCFLEGCKKEMAERQVSLKILQEVKKWSGLMQVSLTIL